MKRAAKFQLLLARKALKAACDAYARGNEHVAKLHAEYAGFEARKGGPEVYATIHKVTDAVHDFVRLAFEHGGREHV